MSYHDVTGKFVPENLPHTFKYGTIVRGVYLRIAVHYPAHPCFRPYYLYFAYV
jgi:hypothetical protein